MKFDSYFDLMIAFAVKTVLTMVNDHSWQNTADHSDMVRKLFTVNKNCEIFGVGEVRLVWLVRNLIEPQVGKSQILQYRDIIRHMAETGEIGVEEIGVSKIYHLKIDDAEKYLEPRKF